MAAYVFIFMLSATVLGLSAHFASIFLPNLHHDFTIMALACSALTIFVFILLIQWSQPQIEVVFLPVLAIFWLAVGCYAGDIIGQVECFPLGNQKTAAKNNGETSAQAFCYEMKVIEAFSLAIFVLFIIFFVLVIALTSRAVTMGNRRAWSDHITELPWFGEYYYQGAYGGYGVQQMYYPPGAIQQQPGHSVIIQPGHHGQPTTVSQVPL